MAEQPVAGFGGLLRQLRVEAGLTQEELAEAATLSPRSVSDLERGINATARKDTARLLADALHLDGQARALFEAAARGRVPAEEALAAARGDKAGGSAAATRTLPRDIASFTGRQDELGQLVAQWAGAAAGGGVVSIHAIGGMAGVGKTAFAVHAAHQLARRLPRRAVFPAAARPYARAAAGRPRRWAGQLAADRRGARHPDPAGRGCPGGALA